MARKIEVQIVGDSRGLENTFKRAGNSAQTFSSKVGGALRGVSGTATVATAAISAAVTAVAIKSISAASDLGEQINKSSVLFGDSAEEIKSWSKTTANSIGLSQRAALEGAGNFAGMFDTLNLGDAVSAKMSKRLVGLGADLASFANEDPSEMLDRVRAGLAGEAEPLRRFGILLSEARVKQEAYRIGLAKVGAELTEQQKVQARYSLILKDSAAAQGDFARTSDSFANAQRIVRANLENLAAQIGGVFLPIVAKATSAFGKFLGRIGEAQGFRAKLDVVFEGVKEVASGLFEQLRSAFAAIDFGEVIESVRGALGGVGNIILRLFDRIDWSRVGAALGDGLRSALEFLTSIDYGAIIRQVVTRVQSAVGQLVSGIDFGQVGRDIGNALVSALNGIASFVNKTDWGQVGKAIVDGFKQALKALGSFLAGVNWLAVLGATFRAAVAVISGFATLFGTVAIELGKAILKGIGQGLLLLGKFIVDKLKQIPGAWVEAARFYLEQSKRLGKAVIDGIGRGLDDAKNFVLRKLLAFVNRILGVTGFLGRFDPFKGVREKVQTKLKAMEADAKTSSKGIQSSINSVKGKTVESVIKTTQAPEGGFVEALDRIRGGAASRTPRGPAGRGQAQEGRTNAAKKLAAAERAAAEAIRKARIAAAAAVEKAAAAAAAAAEKAQEAFEALMGSFDLNLDRAATTKPFKDDLRVLSQMEAAIKARIRAEGKTLDLERRLFEVQQQRVDVRRQQREALASQRKTRQFAALGLGPEGEERIPGVATLRKQLTKVGDVIKGTFLDTGKTRSLLQNIRKLLSGQLGVLSGEVRGKVKELLSGLNEQLKQGATGPRTKFQKANTDAMLRNLGLDPEQIKALKARLSQIGPGGTAPRKGIGAFGFAIPATAPSGGGRGGDTFIINGNIVANDPDAFVREAQKKGRRSTSSRRGVRPGQNRGLG